MTERQTPAIVDADLEVSRGADQFMELAQEFMAGHRIVAGTTIRDGGARDTSRTQQATTDAAEQWCTSHGRNGTRPGVPGQASRKARGGWAVRERPEARLGGVPRPARRRLHWLGGFRPSLADRHGKGAL